MGINSGFKGLNL